MGSFCKEILCSSTMPCRPMLFLVHFCTPAAGARRGSTERASSRRSSARLSCRSGEHTIKQQTYSFGNGGILKKLTNNKSTISFGNTILAFPDQSGQKVLLLLGRTQNRVQGIYANSQRGAITRSSDWQQTHSYCALRRSAMSLFGFICYNDAVCCAV